MILPSGVDAVASDWTRSWPTYATRIPPSATLRFALHRGGLEGESVLDWRNDGEHYEMHLEGRLFGRPIVEQASRGGFDAAGVAPDRFADQRRGVDLRAANFRRDRDRISFSGPTHVYQLPPGAQDRGSWLVQIAAVAEASNPPLAPGDTVRMLVVDARGLAALWNFEVLDRDQGRPHLIRHPVRAYDLEVEIWLDPAQHHWPRRWRQTLLPGGETYEFDRIEAPKAER